MPFRVIVIEKYQHHDGDIFWQGALPGRNRRRRYSKEKYVGGRIGSMTIVVSLWLENGMINPKSCLRTIAVVSISAR